MKKNVIFAKVEIPKSWDAKLFTNEKNENKKETVETEYGN